jgi:uncharacterized protein
VATKFPKFLTAEWRHLVMLNFAIDPALLRDRVPAGTELDFWNDRTYVSIVGFRFLNTRIMGVSIPFHRHFSEVNLRFYVRRKAGDEWRRGVVFIKEIVAVPAIAAIARWVYNEKYITLPMRHQTGELAGVEHAERAVSYSWKWRQKWTDLSAVVQGQPSSLERGSEEEFITEHYWGYASQRDGGTMEYEVEHPPWNVWRATSSELDCDFESLYGNEFVETLTAKPTLALIADGSAIVVRKGVRLT